jgi:transcriptional regulator with XRE-family HTH domain
MNIAYAIDNSKQDIAQVIDSFVITSAMDTLGKRIKTRREELELDQVELARRAGVSQPTLANLESGKNQRTKFLPELARALNVSVEWLDTGSGAKETVRQMKVYSGEQEDEEPRMDDVIELLALFQQCSPRGRDNILDLARAAAKLGHVRWKRVSGEN